MEWTKRGSANTLEEVFLRNIGAASTDGINYWFRQSYNDYYNIDMLDEAVELANRFKNKPVTIVGDYDADGCTATSILYLALTKAGFQNVKYRIPKRFTEGYGLNPVIIDEIESGLVITVDNGIAQLDAIQKAHDKGLTVIILDHHLPFMKDGEEKLPAADIIIDPHAIQRSADFIDYCGAGLAYKFARKLLADDKRTVAGLGVLAAIGTVADVVPLRGENYVIVRNGLKQMTDPNIAPIGMTALISRLGLEAPITSTDVGFQIAPCINAASRMNDDGAKDAVALLVCQDQNSALAQADKLIATNSERKAAKVAGINAAEQTIENDCLFGDVPLIVYVPGVGEGVIGIVAGNLAEKYGVPAIVLTDSDKPDQLKGSARSAGEYNMKTHLDQAADYILKYGGHKGAAGLTIERGQLQNFYNRMREVSTDFEPIDREHRQYDLEIEEKDILSISDKVMNYGPYGEGNPAPVFKVTNFRLYPDRGKYARALGDGSIVKLTSEYTTAVGFDNAGKDLLDLDHPGVVTLYGTITIDRFSGKPQVEFVDAVLNDPVIKPLTSLADRLRRAALGSS